MATPLLHLDDEKIARARQAAARIANGLAPLWREHTTVATERAGLRLAGVDGVTAYGQPLPNLLVDQLQADGVLGQGALVWLARVMVATGKTAREVAEAVAADEESFRLAKVGAAAVDEPDEPVERIVRDLVAEGLGRIRARRSERRECLERLGEGPRPYLYVIVATGNIFEDVLQAQAAARQGADIIAVIRSTGQSLLDYVPYGATTEGFGGTYATQENFRIMRCALDEVGEEIGRYIRLVNYASGLCMPEIAVMGAFERLDVMLNDAMYGIIFRDINMQRTLIDQNFSRVINAYAGVIINTGEDNYLTTADAVAEAHTVLASQFINEQLALLAGLSEEQMGLGYAFEINPDLEDSFLLELAQAAMAREIFPRAPLKYMPPTKHITGDIFRAYLMNGLFNLVGVMTGQGIQLLGMLTEAIHTPFLHDRALAIANARYVMNAARHLGEEVVFRADGRVVKRAQAVLDEALGLLTEIEDMGLLAALEKGLFAQTSRPRDGGKGLAGVIKKEPGYANPFLDAMLAELKGGPLR